MSKRTHAIVIIINFPRWQLTDEESGDAVVSIWPQSGETDLDQLQLSLLTDNDDHQDNDSGTIKECPQGLYWCRDTCHSQNICLEIRNKPADKSIQRKIIREDFNVLSTMLEPKFFIQVLFSIFFIVFLKIVFKFLGGFKSQNQWSILFKYW